MDTLSSEYRPKPMNRQKYLNVAERRAEALDIVDSNLRRANQYLRYGVPSIVDMVPYHSPSGNFDAPANLNSYRTNTGQPLINAIDKIQNIEDFIQRMMCLLEKLNPQQKHTIIEIYFSEKPRREYGRAVSKTKETALEILAIHDETVEYSIADYHYFHIYELQEGNSSRKIYKFYLNEVMNLFELKRDEMLGLLGKLPKKERGAFASYVDLKTSEELWRFKTSSWRLLKRAVLTLAYWAEEIDIDETYFKKTILEQTGTGAAAYLEKLN